MRSTFRWTAGDLAAAGLQTRIGASSMTLGGLLKHLASVEDYAFTTELSGEPIGAPCDITGWDASNDREFSSAADDSAEQLYVLWDGAVERSHARARRRLGGRRAGPSSSTSPGPSGRQASPRRLMFDLVEEVRPTHWARRPAPRGCRGGR